MIEEKDLYWLAGIFDGESYLTTNKRLGVNKSEISGYITRIGVGNTDSGMIKRISEIYCELGVKFYYTLHNPPKMRPDSMKYISINIEGYKSCKKILEVIKGKTKSLQKNIQISLMLDYINYKILGENINKSREEKIELKEKIDDVFVEKLKEAKRFQISPSTTKRIASTVLSW